MAEGGFESYLHVPQQTRKDKLRVFMAQNQHHPLAPPPPFLPDLQGRSKFFPSYDLSLPSSSGLLSPNYNSLSLSAVTSTVEPTAVKGQAVGNINTKPHTSMGLLGGVINATSSTSSSSSSPSASPNYLDSQVLQLQPSFPINPSSVHQGHINNSYNNPFLYTSNHNLSEVVVFKPELLSLSLSSHYDNNAHHQHQTNLPLELDLRRYGPAIYDDMVTWSGGYMVVPSGSTSNDVSTSSVPLAPFTGYASILKESKFLKPAQQLLEELFCGVGGGERSSFDVSVMDPPIDQCLSDIGLVDDPLISGKKSKLILMLEEVYKRDKQYYQHIQAVVASFECVAGLGNAASYANLALKATSKHFKSLKNAIADQLQLPNKAYGQLSHGKEAMNCGNIDRGPGGQRLVQGLGFTEQRPVWRPQRGLPERAVAVLRTWLFEHFLHPYPTDRDKLMLAKQTGLSRNQVSNWFINARVRLWKPMVDEIHKLETEQAQKDSEREELNASGPSDQVIGSNSNALSNPSIPTPRISDVTWKCTRNELSDLHVGGEKPLNFSYNSLSSHPPAGIALSMAGGSSGVSLTLGLHQNNGLGLSEPFSIGAAHHVGHGLEANNEGYVMGGSEAQNRQFGRDVIGGQLFT